jgi:hypothetical protein
MLEGILFTILGVILITRGFVVPEFIDDVINEIFYWILRVLWAVIWSISGLSVITLGWFGDKLSELWLTILAVGACSPMIIACTLLAFGMFLHLLFTGH